MKTLSLVLGALTMTVTVATAQTTYTGNGNTSFGGPLGNSSLTVSDNPATGMLTFQLTAGGPSTDTFVFYIDSTTGGFNSTATLTDAALAADAGRRAITGTDGISRSTVNFATNFNADFGFNTSGSNGGANSTLYQLAAGNLNYVNSPVTTLNGNTFTISISEASLGLTAGSKLGFVATLLNPYDGTDKDVNGNPIAVYRAGESLGTSTPSVNPNPGTAGTLTFSNFDAYTITAAGGVPEPSTVATVTLAAILGGGYFVRRHRENSAVV